MPEKIEPIGAFKLSVKQPKQLSTWHFRRWLYPVLVLLVFIIWTSYMTLSESWHLFRDYWSVSLTMVLGSFIAGATPQGGAAVAFPVFTKVLHIPSGDARTFGLLIQAVGMTMATVVIIVRRVKILPRVIVWVSLGGILGQLMGTYLFTIPNPYPKILFTFTAVAFGVALALSHWVFKWPTADDLPEWNMRYRITFFIIGILGGAFAAQTGSGIDMLTFMVLTLAFGVKAKISTPTTVAIMALNSIVGFFLHGVISQDIGIVWNYWLVAVPVAILSAPLGAVVASKVRPVIIVQFLLVLYAVELATTLWLVPFRNVEQVAVTGLAVAFCAVWFTAMLRWRHKRLGKPQK